jgi:hypothetical protein
MTRLETLQSRKHDIKNGSWPGDFTDLLGNEN